MKEDGPEAEAVADRRLGDEHRDRQKRAALRQIIADVKPAVASFELGKSAARRQEAEQHRQEESAPHRLIDAVLATSRLLQYFTM